MHQYMLGANYMLSSSSEKDNRGPSAQVDHELAVCPCSKEDLGFFRNCITSRLREVIQHLALLKSHLGVLCPVLSSPVQERWTYWNDSSKEPFKLINCLEYLPYKERLRDVRFINLNMRQMKWDLNNKYLIFYEVKMKNKARLFSVILSEKTRGNGHKTHDIPFQHKKTHFSLLRWPNTSIGCGLSILEDYQNLTGQSAGQPALDDPV